MLPGPPWQGWSLQKFGGGGFAEGSTDFKQQQKKNALLMKHSYKAIPK